MEVKMPCQWMEIMKQWIRSDLKKHELERVHQKIDKLKKRPFNIHN